jgi:hypothetical protein
MTYKHLLDSLTALNLHPLAETNVHAVTEDKGAASLDFDQSEVEAGKADFYQAEKDNTELQQENSDLERKLEIAESQLDEIRDEGGTLRQYVARTKQAEETAANWKAHAEKCELETMALRKRKGVAAGYLQEQTNVLRLLSALSAYPDTLTELLPTIKTVLSRIHVK